MGETGGSRNRVERHFLARLGDGGPRLSAVTKRGAVRIGAGLPLAGELLGHAFSEARRARLVERQRAKGRRGAGNHRRAIGPAGQCLPLWRGGAVRERYARAMPLIGNESAVLLASPGFVR